MSRDEMHARGWNQCDIILVTGDAYVDHPSFGVALIGRWLESRGYRVGVIAAPDPADDEAFRVLGPPRLFWGVTAGNLDSQLSRLTVMRKRRRDDPYLPEGWGDRRPSNATIFYVTKVRQAFKSEIRGRRSEIGCSTVEAIDRGVKYRPPTPDFRPPTSGLGAPVIIGGLEASLRRFAFYDYWTDGVKRSILFDSKADLLVYGMAEQAIAEVAARLDSGRPLSGIAGTAEIITTRTPESGVQDPGAPGSGEVSVPQAGQPHDSRTAPRHTLPSFEEVSTRKEAFTKMTRDILLNAASDAPVTLIQPHGDRSLVVYPPPPALDAAGLDRIYSLPFTRKPHPSYGQQRLAAYEMIKDSITTHRGCYGSCAFCAIATHQGKRIISRSPENILDEVQQVARAPGFHGTITDLGGPTANMYATRCRKEGAGCRRPGCLSPSLCPQLETSALPQVALLRAARRIPGVKHLFIGSGIRFDLALAQAACGYIGELAAHHVGGRLKIAPEHITDTVLKTMRKPDAGAYREFTRRFREASLAAGKPQQIIEYFISGHPGCTLDDMIELALYLKRGNIRPEQVQDFYPAPLTLAGAMFHTGRDPLTGEAVHVPRTDNEKAMQRALLLYHEPAFHRKAREALRAAGREDLIGQGRNQLVPSGP